MEELHSRELLFVQPPPGTARAVIEGLLAEDFVEIGASGGICTRAEGIEVLLQRALAPPEEQWKVVDYAVRHIDENVRLATYILAQPGRKTRRATVWRRENGVWRAVYHQGTIMQGGTR